MWHSTQFTRACEPTECARVSSGCTEWHIVAQKWLLFVYSQPATPTTVATATPATARARAVKPPTM
jgi:hypothetical protein